MKTKIILKQLGNISKEERSEIYVELRKMIKNDRAKYMLSPEEKKAISVRTEELYENTKGDIPRHIFGHRNFHKELNSSTWSD